MQSLTDPKAIRELLQRHGFHFSKALGQNFIINPGICPRIAQLGGAGPGVGVLEIGPGIGVLTEQLAKLAEKVVCLEIDSRLFPILEETLAEHNNVKVIHADVLKTDLHSLLAQEFAGMEVVVCANLPYYITSPILMKLLEERLPVRAITVMVQKEAAVRLCAEPGSREAGAITLAVQYYSKPKKLFEVHRGSFLPAPNVDSTVMRLDVLPQPPVAVEDERFFFRVVSAAFSMRRKTLPNCLNAGLGLPKPQLQEVLEGCGISPNARAEALTLEQFAALAQALLPLCRE